MTPTEIWMMDLALVYSVPSFIAGIGVTLLFVRWQDVRQAAAMIPRFLSPKLMFERRGFTGTAPADEIHRH